MILPRFRLPQLRSGLSVFRLPGVLKAAGSRGARVMAALTIAATLNQFRTSAAEPAQPSPSSGELFAGHALDIETGDVDCDGRLDLIVLLGGRAATVRVFYGAADGYSPQASDELTIAARTEVDRGDLVAADLNHDGRHDIVVTCGAGAARVLWNRVDAKRGELHRWPCTPLGTGDATTAAATDVDQDGLIDLVTGGAETRVFWGHATRTFVTHASTPLPVRGQPVSRTPGAVNPSPPGFTPPLVAKAEHVVLHREKGRYSAFPTLYHVSGAADALHVHFGARETSSHVEARQVPYDLVSTDGGRRWEKSVSPTPNPVWRSSDGRLVNVTTHGWRHVESTRRPELEAQGFEVRNAPDGRVTYSVGCILRVSADGGAHWQERPIAVPPQALISGYHDECATLRLDDRTILRAIYGKPVARVRYYESWLLRSEDNGATWSFGTIAADLSRDDRGFSETAIAEAANDDIVAMMRIEPPMGTHLWTARSVDRGKTWSKAVETPLRGFPAHLLRLRDGSVLCTYGYRESPMGIRAALSRDHGRTWLERDIVSLRNDGAGPPSDNGYPITAELSDGTLVTVYYLTREGITGVEATRWQNPWR